MTLALPGLDIAQRHREDADASQWFTPMPIADRMWRWSGLATIRTVLEPSAGSGNLIHAAIYSRRSEGIRDVLGDDRSRVRVTAHELDGHYVDRMRERFRSDSLVDVRAGSYLDAPAPDDLYDLALMNPPYENGLDGKFLAKAMNESQRVIALVRLAALVGQARTEAVWSRCRPDGDFVLRGLALFSGRPRFEAGRSIGDREDGGSAKADFCVVKLSRRTEPERGVDVPTHIEWWS